MRAETHCTFEKPILSGQCACERSVRSVIGERVGVECASAIACANCRTLLAFLRERARFALKVADTTAPMPFGKEMKLMIGGLLGLQRVLQETAAEATTVADIHELVHTAKGRYGSLAEIPYEDVVRSIAAFRSRRRAPR